MSAFTLFRDQPVDLHLYTKADPTPGIIENGVALHQVHGNAVTIVHTPSDHTVTADAALTNAENLCLTIRVADCQAFAFYVPEYHVAGVLHAGWRGLVNGIIPAFFKRMKQKWTINPATVLIAATPSLCMQCAEFSDPVRELQGIKQQFFYGRHADLRAIADDQLMQCGFKAEHIERHADCTKCNPEQYWTYRGGDRDDVKNGSSNVLTLRLKTRE